ncbi:MAG: response regulator [Kofleriaceae bacterium]|jgi:chemotaxis protein histidine kinase CheA/ActR/RegA family two-component response regulator|nr:response regulator [Kofleriaceae bacterium]MBP6838399.1 response regulator [Kofleriaceae bacterium]MBP9205610.1 response regulator [Kofleriaceae bacterium]
MSRELDFDADELAMLRQLFRDEAHQALETVTRRAQAVGSAAPTAEALNEMMRVTHTLKGAAGTVGLDDVVELAHRLESALAYVGAGLVAWTADSGDRVIEIVDGLRAVVDGPGQPAAVRSLIDRLAAGRSTTMAPPMGEADLDSGPVRVGAGASAASPGDPEGRPGGPASLGADVVGDRAVLRVEAARVDELMSATGELLFDRTRIERRVQALRTLTRDVARSRQAVLDHTDRMADGELRRGLLAVEAELAAQSTQLSQATAALLDEVEALRRTIGELQRGLTRMRMQTARALFQHLARAVRAVSRAVGARVEVRSSGDETEFDKSVAEQIVDPIIQLLRNAVVHGIEPAEQRLAAGKPASGLITLGARSDGNLLVLEVSDDGRGIDPGALRRRFVATGHWSAARAGLAGDDEVLAALFDPGVSSRDDADELAGRGIGLDLVRQAIARLGGEVRLSSQAGRGTTFTLRLPLSTAVAQATLFKVAGQVYALPDVHVVDTVTIDPGQQAVPDRGEVVPIVRLADQLGVQAAPGRGPGLLVEYAGRRLVCAVDKVIGSREIIVKPLGPLLSGLPWYAGATISASGKVQLIIDTVQLVRAAFPGAQLTGGDERPAMPTGPAGRALVVDDSRAIREAMTSMLAREGWVVDVAEDGGRALQMASQHGYDLIVTDLEMPQVAGFEFIGRLRGELGLADVPVVVITSRASPDSRRRARELGVRALVAKPITRRKLLEALAAARAAPP